MGAPGSAAAEHRPAFDHEETEALNQSHKILEQVFSVDSKSPDLVDQIADHSEPTSHNYFFEPYSSTTLGWQPQLVHKQKLLPYPVAITSAYDNMRSGSFSGLLQEIHHAWVSVDNTLFLWDYTRTDRFTAFEGMEQMISAVSIAKPIPGVFKPFVKHLVIVATASEMRILVVLYENNDPIHGALRLQPTALCISTDDCAVKKIQCTNDGRIFFGGSDGLLHEFVYDAEEGMLHQIGLKRKCRKVSYLQSISQSLSYYFPNVVHSLTGGRSSEAKIFDMVVDTERQILYVLQEPATIHVYDISTSEISLVVSKDIHGDAGRFCQRNHRTWTSCPEPRLFGNTTITLTSLSIVARDESATIHLVAVSSTGIRFYLSTFTTGYFSSNSMKRPSHLDIMHIRLPPPMLSLKDAPEYHVTEGLSPAISTGKSPSQVHRSFYRKGVFLAIDGGPDAFDSVIGLCQDSTARHNQDANTTSLKRYMRESISAESCQGKVSDVEEFIPSSVLKEKARSIQAPATGTKRSFTEMQSNNPSPEEPKAMLSELVGQFFQPVRHFLVLTNAGLHIFQKVRPLDQLHRILQAHSPGKELSAKLLHFVKCFGQAETCAMLFSIATEANCSYSVAALQSIFEFGGNPGVAPSSSNLGANSNSFILTDDMCMSYHHDGLVKFIARTLRPFWNTTNPAEGTSFETVRIILRKLQRILATQYAAAIQHPLMASSEPSRFNTMTRTLNELIYESNPSSLREENAIRAEQFSIRCLYRFTLRAAETLSLLVACHRQMGDIAAQAPLPFAELVTTQAGASACKVLIQQLMADVGHSEELVLQLRDECATLFADTDAAQSHGFQALELASESVTIEDQEKVLKTSLEHFTLASKNWSTESQVQVLESICAAYFSLGYLDGIVDLSLTCARQLNKPEVSELRRYAYGCILQVVHFFLLPQKHQDLSICDNVPALWTSAEEREKAVEKLLARSLESSDKQFHHVLYTWLYENDQQKRLIELKSPLVEAFLQAKDEELLIKQYLLQSRYIDAARILWDRAQDENPQLESNRTVTERLELMSRAASVLAAANLPEAANALEEVRETMDVLQLQLNIWKTLNERGVPEIQDLKYRILDVSVLYNQYAVKHQLWSDCLRIIRCCHTEDANTIQHLWERVLFACIPKSATNNSFNEWIESKHCESRVESNHLFESATWISRIQSKLTPLGKELALTCAFPVEFLVHELEHVWMWFIQLTHFNGPKEWIGLFLLDCGVPYSQLFGIYHKLYESNQAPRWRFHLLGEIHQLIQNWQNLIHSRSTHDQVLEFATATPLLMSACESYVVDLHALVGDAHNDKQQMMILFRQLREAIAATKSKYT